MKENKTEVAAVLIALYLGTSITLWLFRFMLGDDCAPRYIDYVFPITKLHCEALKTEIENLKWAYAELQGGEV